MTNEVERQYVGDGRQHYKPLEGAYKKAEPYIALPSLVEAVNAALYLRRPLLLEGEPGCGKTRLAYAVAYELGYPLYTCYIRSTSRAQDLLYEYDALRRLYDVQESNLRAKKLQEGGAVEVSGDALDPKNYVHLGELGEAINLSAAEERPSVVLIDEIDKADIDFPNDLLQPLDEMKFTIRETNRNIDALSDKSRKERRNILPLFIITSNREKELPQPFLRRCLFYYIKFPDLTTMRQVVKSHSKDFNKTPIQSEKPLLMSDLFEKALIKFWSLRKERVWRKIVGTSELLDWLRVLEEEESLGKLTAEKLEGINLLKDLPHLETLIKTQSDRDKAENFMLSDSSL